MFSLQRSIGRKVVIIPSILRLHMRQNANICLLCLQTTKTPIRLVSRLVVLLILFIVSITTTEEVIVVISSTIINHPTQLIFVLIAFVDNFFGKSLKMFVGEKGTSPS